LVKAELSHSHYASLKIKDAVVDQFRNRTGKRPNIDVRKPGIRINLHVEGTAATLALDLSGDSLHRRGYRAGGGEAPLKETLAAAVVHLSGIHQDMEADHCLLDPMCGSGTLLIEAALILGDSAPGLLRKTFGFMYWHRHNKKLWEKLVAEALEREDKRTEIKWPPIIGYDADPHVVAVARKNIINAGLKDKIVVKQRQLDRLQPPAAKGIMVTNPPYGERLSEKESVKYLYRCLGRIFRTTFEGWQLGFFTANPDLADMLGVSWQQRFRLYNGPIKCRLLTAVSPGGKEQDPHLWKLQKTDKELPAEDFSNRLHKNCQTLIPWARENDITCFRIYDADMPEYNLAIDLFEQWVHVQEYAPPATVAPDKAKERFNQALQVIRHLLAVPHSDLFLKTRQKQQSKQHHKKQSRTGKLYEVHEGGSRFLVNFTDFQDTGLLLDQRKIRALIGEISSGRTFLNLFSYTGSATVCAAMGGATSTVTVELSDQYLARAKANLSLNGFGGPLHRFIPADCMQWLRSGQERYGVIVVDAPTFARHQNLVFDIQQDHEQLLCLAMERLSRDGVLIFSSSSRKFKLKPALEHKFIVEEITNQTIPDDFKRSKHIHRCFRFAHRAGIIGE
ncbi:MAG: bifunctional 23S rRNA (guanine(2069)-N(7))-methyltransferase RlmK/23S rRNA (guanine(2445)-N(2))-methyltransferase RlmL, partial [Deltaproteobacteria bacterium]|nr:bifunctional 23S rRNA (guanine(2069)-N(7))-methyltransferase RlmK/23S rRNA (guanine(2445)-N(2))-methyltransferase RlmL [Deltaproteobacteria bacterium]